MSNILVESVVLDENILKNQIRPLIISCLDNIETINDMSDTGETLDENIKKSEISDLFKKKKWSISNTALFDRLNRYSRIDHSSNWIRSIFYLEKISRDLLLYRDNIQLCFCILYVLSIKYNEDEHYSNKYYSQVCDIPLIDFNKLEALMLYYLNYNLHIDDDILSEFILELIYI